MHLEAVASSVKGGKLSDMEREQYQNCSYLFVPQWGAEARGERRSGRMADEGWLTETNQPFFVPLGVITI